MFLLSTTLTVSAVELKTNPEDPNDLIVKNDDPVDAIVTKMDMPVLEQEVDKLTNSDEIQEV